MLDLVFWCSLNSCTCTSTSSALAFGGVSWGSAAGATARVFRAMTTGDMMLDWSSIVTSISEFSTTNALSIFGVSSSQEDCVIAPGFSDDDDDFETDSSLLLTFSLLLRSLLTRGSIWNAFGRLFSSAPRSSLAGVKQLLALSSTNHSLAAAEYTDPPAIPLLFIFLWPFFGLGIGMAYIFWFTTFRSFSFICYSSPVSKWPPLTPKPELCRLWLSCRWRLRFSTGCWEQQLLFIIVPKGLIIWPLSNIFELHLLP